MRRRITGFWILATILGSLFFGTSCASIKHSDLQTTAIKKTEAAIFYFEHGDYTKSKELCMEALTMWSQMQVSTPSDSVWWVKKKIDECNRLLQQIKKIQSPHDPEHMSI